MRVFTRCVCDGFLRAMQKVNGYDTQTVRLRLHFFLIVVTGSNKLALYQLLVAMCFAFFKCRLLLSKVTGNFFKMPVRRNRRIGERRMLAERRQRCFFFVFMFWQMQQVRRMMLVHPINELRLEKGEFYTLYPDLHHFPPKFFNMYRMSVPKFDAWLTKLVPKLEKKWTIMCEPLSPEQKLVITLR